MCSLSTYTSRRHVRSTLRKSSDRVWANISVSVPLRADIRNKCTFLQFNFDNYIITTLIVCIHSIVFEMRVEWESVPRGAKKK